MSPVWFFWESLDENCYLDEGLCSWRRLAPFLTFSIPNSKEQECSGNPRQLQMMYHLQHNSDNDESSSLTNYKYKRQQTDNMSTSLASCTDESLPKDIEAPSNGGSRIKKLLISASIVSIILFAIIDSQTNRHIQTAFESFLDWISTHLIAGMFAFIAVYALATVTCVPGSILTIGSGFIYGNALGLARGVAVASFVVFIGASCGAMLSFLVGRYLMRELVSERFVARYPIIKALDQSMKHQGLEIFILLRLSPIVPFNIINYIGGVTAISFKDYSLALFGILPGTVLYCFIGASAGSLLETDDMMNGTFTYVGIGESNEHILYILH
jgi:uncharacterized membrane protein YdjX (TVP38/TMEM64 family)